MRFGRVLPMIDPICSAVLLCGAIWPLRPICTLLPMIDPICSAVLLCGAIWPLRPICTLLPIGTVLPMIRFRLSLLPMIEPIAYWYGIAYD
jgi:hypothetical protein